MTTFNNTVLNSNKPSKRYSEIKPMTTSNDQATLSSAQLSQAIEQLNQFATSDLIEIYNDYADSNSYERIYDNDDETINDLYQDASDALRAAFFGDYNHSHNYFVLNGYGNLQSFDYLDSDNSPIDIDDLSKWIVDNELYSNYDIEVTTLDDMLSCIEDNIGDDEGMLEKLSFYLYTDVDVDACMREIGNYSYPELNDIIDHLNINYN